MISDLQKSCKHSAESSLIPLTHLSLMFTYSITIIQLSKLYINIGIIVLTKLQTLFKYHQFFKLIYMSVPGSTEDPTLYLIYSSLPVCDFFIPFRTGQGSLEAGMAFGTSHICPAARKCPQPGLYPQWHPQALTTISLAVCGSPWEPPGKGPVSKQHWFQSKY